MPLHFGIRSKNYETIKPMQWSVNHKYFDTYKIFVFDLSFSLMGTPRTRTESLPSVSSLTLSTLTQEAQDQKVTCGH